MMGRLRRLVGSKAWDYCVLWKLSEDHRFLEWVDCCCGGADHISSSEDGGEEVNKFAGSESHLPCKDMMIQHPATISCPLLAQLPSSISLHSPGIHAQTLISNQPSWFKSSNIINSDSGALEETVGTRVLIPVLGGLIELFATKQVSEDQNIIDFITDQYNNMSMEHEPVIKYSSNMDPSNFAVNNIVQYSMNTELGSESLILADDQVPLEIEVDQNNLGLPNDICVDRISLCSPSPMNFHQFNYAGSSDNKIRQDYKNHHHHRHVGFFEEPSHDHHFFAVDNPLMDSFRHSDNHNEIQEMDTLQNSMIPNSESNMHMQYMDASGIMDQQGNNYHEKDCVKKEINGRSDSDCSDQNDEEDDAKYRKRTGKEPQSKNLVAERRRRKKLNERLYALRALVPKISKLDRASILGDAIEFVKELQIQAKDLQDELGEHTSDDDGTKKMNNVTIFDDQNNSQFNQNLGQTGTIMIVGHRQDHDRHKAPTHGFNHVGASSGYDITSSSKYYQQEISNDKGQSEGEAQVEVAEIDADKLLINVFCKHKAGGFTRLLEVLDSLGLEVTNANVTSFRCLVSIVFEVHKKRESGTVESDDVKKSLLELIRNLCSRGWPPEMAEAVDDDDDDGESNNYTIDYHHLHHLQNQHT